MIVIMRTGATEQQIAAVRKQIRELGFKDHPILGEERVVVAVLGHVYLRGARVLRPDIESQIQ